MYTAKTYLSELRHLIGDVSVFIDGANEDNKKKMSEIAKKMTDDIAMVNGALRDNNIKAASASSLELTFYLREIRELAGIIDHGKIDGYISALEALQSE